MPEAIIIEGNSGEAKPFSGGAKCPLAFATPTNNKVYNSQVHKNTKRNRTHDEESKDVPFTSRGWHSDISCTPIFVLGQSFDLLNIYFDS